MSLKLNQELLIKLTKDKELLNSKLEKIEAELLEQTAQAKAELEELQSKRLERERTIELFETLLEIENEADFDSLPAVLKEKRRKSEYARARLPFIQKQISNYDPNKVKDKSSIMYSSYVSGHAHYVSKLAELTADLDI
jgi:uncharacterized protein YcgL (UPF0745 family)